MQYSLQLLALRVWGFVETYPLPYMEKFVSKTDTKKNFMLYALGCFLCLPSKANHPIF